MVQAVDLVTPDRGRLARDMVESQAREAALACQWLSSTLSIYAAYYAA